MDFELEEEGKLSWEEKLWASSVNKRVEESNRIKNHLIVNKARWEIITQRSCK